MKKALITLIILFTVAISTGYAVLAYLNNREASWPEHARIQASFTAAVGWIDAHQEDIIRDNNPVLWWMIQRSAALTGNSTLQSAFVRYQQKYLETARTLWLPLFFPGRWVPFRNEDIAHFDDYQKFFVYAISCDPDLEQQVVITAQLDPTFCDSQPLRPACATHQLMAFRFMQQNRCGATQSTQSAVADLQARIVKQLTWDPRVVDVYLQRVLMLTESGAVTGVKPVWLQQVLDAQLPDGGWGGLDPYLQLPSGSSLGFGGRGFAIAAPISDFHATAQGILLMSLLLNAEPVRP